MISVICHWTFIRRANCNPCSNPEACSRQPPRITPRSKDKLPSGQWKSQPVEEPEVMENLAVLTYRVIGHEDIWFPRFYSILFWLVGEWGSFFCLKP